MLTEAEEHLEEEEATLLAHLDFAIGDALEERLGEAFLAHVDALEEPAGTEYLDADELLFLAEIEDEIAYLDGAMALLPVEEERILLIIVVDLESSLHASRPRVASAA